MRSARACHVGDALLQASAYAREHDAGSPDGVDTWCRGVPGRPDARVCLTGPYENAEVGMRYRASYRIAARTLLRWDTEAMPPMMPMTFTAERIDLDGDGTSELLVGVMATESNGIGLSRWRLSVIGTDRAARSARLLDTVALENYGDTSGFFRFRGQRGCRLLVSEWKEGADPRRGEGLYVHGRWMRWNGARFVPDASLPALRRRYLFGFERAHLQGPKPMRWFLRSE